MTPPLGHPVALAACRAENLESRLLFSSFSTLASPSALVPTFGNVSLAPQAIAGFKLNAKVPVVITDPGSAFKGDASITLYADTTTSLDGNQVQIAPSIVRNLSLRANGSRTFNLSVKSLPSTLPDGTYYVLADVVDSTGNTTVIATEQTVTVSPPSDSLTPVSGVVTQAPNGSASGSVTITNMGNSAPASGLSQAAFYSSPDGSTQDALLTQYSLSLPLQANKSRTLHFHLTADEQAEAVGDGYVLVDVTDPSGNDQTLGIADNGSTSSGPGRGGVDFLTLLGFNADGSTWNYNITASSGGRSVSGTGMTAVNADSPTSWDWSTNITAAGAQAVNEDLTWEQTPSGVNLDAVAESDETINFDSPQICGPTLSGKSIEPTPITIDVGDETDALSGSATLTTTLVGNAKVSVPAGVFSATEITLRIAFNANNYGDNGDGSGTISAQGTDVETFYGVNGIGLVKIVSSAAESESQSGQGALHVSSTITSKMTSYDYVAP